MKRKTIITLIVSSILLVLIFGIALMVGKYSISFVDFFKAIFTQDSAFEMQRSIIVNLRLPRTIIAGLTGIGLSLSGLLYQEIFQNKLVSPDLLGVSTGASVGAAAAILLGLSSAFVSLFAFILGVATVLITLLISRLFKNGSQTILLLSGIIVGGFMSSLLAIIKYCADPESTLATITYWLMGSFENSKMTDVYVLLPIIAVCSIALIILSYRVGAMAMGKEQAQTKGINYTFYKILFIGIATLMTAACVSFCGTISWVGLVIPHIVRLLVGKNTSETIPLTLTFGGCFMILTDILSRSFTDSEIPISAITGIIGTIVFVVILISFRRNYNVR